MKRIISGIVVFIGAIGIGIGVFQSQEVKQITSIVDQTFNKSSDEEDEQFSNQIEVKNQNKPTFYQETKKQEPKKLSVNGNHTYFPKTNDKTNRWVTLIGGIVVMSGIGCAILANKREKSPNKLFDDYVK